MTMLKHCQQQDLCHLESRGGKPFISKTKCAFCVGKRRQGGARDFQQQAPAPRIRPTVVHDRFTSFVPRRYNRRYRC